MEMTQEAFDAMQSTITALTEKLNLLETQNTENAKWQNQINQITEKLTALEAKAQNSPTTDPELLQQIMDLRSKLEVVTTKAEALEQHPNLRPPSPPNGNAGDNPDIPPRRQRPGWIR